MNHLEILTLTAVDILLSSILFAHMFLVSLVSTKSLVAFVIFCVFSSLTETPLAT